MDIKISTEDLDSIQIQIGSETHVYHVTEPLDSFPVKERIKYLLDVIYADHIDAMASHLSRVGSSGTALIDPSEGGQEDRLILDADSPAKSRLTKCRPIA